MRWTLDRLAMLPLAFPGIVMAVAILKMYLTIPIPIYGTVWIMVAAFIARYLPYAMRYRVTLGCEASIASSRRARRQAGLAGDK